MPLAHHTRLALATALVAALALPASGCARSGSRIGELAATGTVVADQVVVSVPTLAVPSPDLAVGFAPATSGMNVPAGPGTRAQVATAAAAISLGARTRIASMAVETGSIVREGDLLAVMDDSLLRANVVAARAAAAQARANRDLVSDSLDTVNTNADTLATTREKLVTTIANLEQTRAQIAAQLAAAKDGLAKLEATLAAREKLLRSLPPEAKLPTATIPPGATSGAAMPDPATLRTAIAKMTAGLAKLDAGLAKAKAGLAKLDSAKAKLADARTTLRNTRPLTGIAVTLADDGVELAAARLAQATVYAPCAGSVLDAAREGEVLAPGAPLVTLRPTRESRVQLWLDGSELAGVSAGARASVRIDSRPGEVFSARVTLVGAETDFPPTTLATKIIHLTRAAPVQVTLDSATIPPGTPADVTISTR